jgi:hypothetical protein
MIVAIVTARQIGDLRQQRLRPGRPLMAALGRPVAVA